MRTPFHSLVLITLIILASGVPASADLKTVTQLSFDGKTTATTVQYTQERKIRWEHTSPDSGSHQPHRTASLLDRDRKSYVILDLDSKQYSEPLLRQDNPLLVLATMVRHHRVRESGKTVNVYFDKVETGEQRQMFGRTARHVILRERREAEPGACTPSSETSIDGWFVSLPERGPRTSASFLTDGYECRDHIVTHGTRTNPGYPVISTERTGKSSGTQEFTSKQEIFELSDAPLDPALFVPPKDYKKVEPEAKWTQEMSSAWQQLESAIDSWFD